MSAIPQPSGPHQADFIEVEGHRVQLPPRDEAIRARHAALKELNAYRVKMAGRWSGSSSELLAEARADRR